MGIGLIVTLVSIVNLALVGGMFFLVWRELGKREQGRILENNSPKSVNSELLERFERLETRLNEHRPAGNDPARSGGSADRMKLAIEKLNRGLSPDLVCRELGYSRSEMSIIRASAGLGRLNIRRV